jgi:hypothetical protein
MYSLKQKMPNAHIVVLSDVLTDEAVGIKSSAISQYINELVVIDLDAELTKKVRSRYLKTNMRNYVDGDFLYIDCDTVIVEQFDPEMDFTDQLMAVPDGHVLFAEHYKKDGFLRQIERFNVDIEGYYWNGGVIFVKDNVLTRTFFKEWHENYIKGMSLGISQDQPSFYTTNLKYRIVTKLPDKYNVQILFGLHYLYEAKVIHLLDTNHNKFTELTSDNFLCDIRKNGITPEASYKILNPIKTFVPKTGIIYGKDLYYYFSKENNECNINNMPSFTTANRVLLQYYKKLKPTGIIKFLAALNILILSFEISLSNIRLKLIRLLGKS